MSTLLKQKLLHLKKKDFNATDKNTVLELMDEMLEHIGNPDPVLRDECIYEAFSYWISGGKFSNEQLINLLQKVLSEKYLFYKIGNLGDDTVFTRSFSVLLIPPIFYWHQRTPFLSKDLISFTWSKLIEYLEAEKDLRGYVHEKGWAHAVAHTADALAKVAASEEITELNIIKAIPVITEKMGSKVPFLHEEEERMALAAVEMMNYCSNETIINWIETLGGVEHKRNYPEDDYVKINRKNFLRSLYFRLLKQDNNQKYLNKIIEQVNKFVKY